MTMYMCNVHIRMHNVFLLSGLKCCCVCQQQYAIMQGQPAQELYVYYTCMYIHVGVAIVMSHTQCHMPSVEGESDCYNVPLYFCGHVVMPQFHRGIVNSNIMPNIEGEFEMVPLHILMHSQPLLHA